MEKIELKYSCLKEIDRKNAKLVFPSIVDSSIITLEKKSEKSTYYEAKYRNSKVAFYQTDSKIFEFCRERFSWFVTFLEENNIPNEIIEAIKLYYYADGTTDGKGSFRLSSQELKDKYVNEIRLVNNYFSKYEKWAIIFNHAFANNGPVKMNYLRYKTSLFSIEEILEKLKSFDSCSSHFMHFGPFNFLPYNRNIDFDPYYEQERIFCYFKLNLTRIVGKKY